MLTTILYAFLNRSPNNIRDSMLEPESNEFTDRLVDIDMCMCMCLRVSVFFPLSFATTAVPFVFVF